jgi:pyruvate formate lyase activating enzyme
MSKNLIFDIKRYAINDGPGIRLVIFFKGCNLHCTWCHNPESISSGVEKMYSIKKCILCGGCVNNCQESAITLTSEGIITDAERCSNCGKCAGVCPTKATEMSGNVMSVTEITALIEKEKAFFDQSGGGVTFSGGEPLMHSGFLIELLEACGKLGIHRAVDTAGNINTQTLLEVAKNTDLFLYDVKLMGSASHKKWTGSGNELILRNLTILSSMGANIIIRIPLIGGINDSVENIDQTVAFINRLAGEKKEVHLLLYHAIAQHKYLKLGKANDFENLLEPDNETIKRVIEQFESAGIMASVGG